MRLVIPAILLVAAMCSIASASLPATSSFAHMMIKLVTAVFLTGLALWMWKGEGR